MPLVIFWVHSGDSDKTLRMQTNFVGFAQIIEVGKRVKNVKTYSAYLIACRPI